MLRLFETLKSIIKFKKYGRFRFKRPYQPDLVFDGRLIANSGNMAIYKTKGGNLVCLGGNQVIDYDLLITDRVIFTEGKTQKDLEHEVIDHFGYCKTARKLYERAGISDVAYVAFIE